MEVYQVRVDDIDGAEIYGSCGTCFCTSFSRITTSASLAEITSGAFSRRFKVLVATPPDAPDQHLLAVRRELEKLLPGEKLDFYLPPLKAAWYDTTESAADFAPLDVIQYKRQIVFFGPPGTGKTYRAKRLAESVIRSAALKRMGRRANFKVQNVVDAAVKTNVHRLQLHPAYSYEDFIRGLHITESGATEYRLGYLPRLVMEIEETLTEPRLPHVLILDEINRTDLSRMLGECFSLLEDRNQTNPSFRRATRMGKP